MSTICEKCKWLWCNGGKPYCNKYQKTSSISHFKKGLKQCDDFEQGENYKRFLKKSKANSCWNKKRGKR